MAKAKIQYTFTFEDDGVETDMVYTQNNIEDLQDWLCFISEGTRAAGFTYVDKIVAVKDDGSEVSSSF